MLGILLERRARFGRRLMVAALVGAFVGSSLGCNTTFDVESVELARTDGGDSAALDTLEPDAPGDTSTVDSDAPGDLGDTAGNDAPGDLGDTAPSDTSGDAADATDSVSDTEDVDTQNDAVDTAQDTVDPCAGVVCEAGQTCLDGQCVAPCDPPLTRCGLDCVDLATSAAHCGACDHACVVGATCNGTVCDCGDGGDCTPETGDHCEAGACRCGVNTSCPKPRSDHCDGATSACLCGTGALCAGGKTCADDGTATCL